MFTCMQHSLTKASGRQVHPEADVHDNIDTWNDLVSSLVSRPTHLRELEHPLPPAWIGATGAAGTGMAGVFWDLEGKYFV